MTKQRLAQAREQARGQARGQASAQAREQATSDFALKRWHWLAPLLVLGAIATWRVIASAWLCDDAFIPLRVVQNFLGGHGLVYNVGERVEVYTSLLWVLAVAGLVRMGVSPEMAAMALGAASYALLVLVLVWQWWSRRDRGRLFPVAAGLVLMLGDFHVWATGGLETATFALLALSGLLLTARSRPWALSDLAASALLGLTVLARPDGLIFFALALTQPWWDGREATPSSRLWRTLCLLVPGALIVAGQAAFKLGYYHELFPTAFYSKSALRPYYSQGAIYVGLWLAKNWAVPLVALATVALGWRRVPVTSWGRSTAFLTLSGAVFALYVIHTGGDFMFARRLIPALPLLFIGIERGLERLGRTWGAVSLIGVLVIGAILPYPIYNADRVRISGIADEPQAYPASERQLRREQGELVGSLLAGSPARVMFEGGMCSFGYYSRLPYLVEMSGLTQYSLAKLPLAQRGLVGHEKAPTPDWIRASNVNFVMTHDDPPFTPGAGGMESDQIYFGTQARALIVRYSDAVMDPLRGRSSILFPTIGPVLIQAREDIVTGDVASARDLVSYLDDYYFHSGGAKATAAAAEFHALLRAKEGH